jgi:glycosyltransferase involved in cell wall biosynthesis
LNENINLVVSIIIPTKGRIEFLKRAIESVAFQKMKGIEVFVLDNNMEQGFSNSVKEIVVACQEEYKEISWHYQHTDKENAAGVRNEGMRAARGKYICFLDDDDELLPNSIAVRVKRMEADAELAFLYCASYSKIYPYPFRMYRYYTFQPWRHTDRIETMSCSSIMINREVFINRQLFFDEELLRRHDYDLCRRVLLAGLKIDSIPAPLVVINLHQHQRISTLPLDMRSTRESLIKKWGESMQEDVFEYAEGLVIWRKCFGLENRSYGQVYADFENEFNRPLSSSFRLRLRLVFLSPVLYLFFYHMGVILSQLYKNKVLPLWSRKEINQPLLRERDTVPTTPQYPVKPYSHTPHKIIQGNNKQIACFENDSLTVNVDRQVVEAFGDEWTKFHDFSDMDIDANALEYFDILDSTVLHKNAYVLDAGCGTGRWSRYIAGKVGFVEAIDPSNAIFAADKLLNNVSNIRLSMATIDNIPFDNETFDMVMSIGVLHHIPDTQKAIKDCVSKIKKNGYFYAYIYYSLDNKGLIYRLLFSIINQARIGISRSPPH